MSFDLIPIIISSFALVISAVTAYLTLFHRGELRMTRPTQMFFGPDGPGGAPKVYVRALLYSTSRQGHVVENMFLRLRRGESSQNFNIWVYRENGNLVRGSGYFVTRDGAALDHHFLLPKDGTGFDFLAGQYTVEVFATLANKATPLLLTRQNVTLETGHAQEFKDKSSGIFFDWGADLGRYHPHADARPKKLFDELLAQRFV